MFTLHVSLSTSRFREKNFLFHQDISHFSHASFTFLQINRERSLFFEFGIVNFVHTVVLDLLSPSSKQQLKNSGTSSISHHVEAEPENFSSTFCLRIQIHQCPRSYWWYRILNSQDYRAGKRNWDSTKGSWCVVFHHGSARRQNFRIDCRCERIIFSQISVWTTLSSKSGPSQQAWALFYFGDQVARMHHRHWNKIGACGWQVVSSG